MKRYNIKADYDVAGYGTYEEEDSNGEWVKYEDMKKEMARIWKDIMPPPSDLLHKGA